MSAGTSAEEREAYREGLQRITHTVSQATSAIKRIEDAYGRRLSASEYERVLRGLMASLHNVNGLRIMLGALRDFRLPPADRAAIERVTSDLQKSRLVFHGASGEKVGKIAHKLADIERALDAIKRAFDQGDVCEQNECSVAGCFRVVNTGGFDRATMDLASKLVSEAATLVNAAGFGQVCYGDAYVTEKVSRDDVLAFYDGQEDRMYVRAKPKRGEAALEVETVIHELGHRLHRKFLVGRAYDGAMAVVFRSWQQELAQGGIESRFDPKPGDILRTSERARKSYRVLSVGGGQGAYRMVTYQRLLPNGEPDPKYLPSTMTVDKLALALGLAGHKVDSFPSPYSKKSPSEMFAELFRAVVVGRATEAQLEAFKRIIDAGH